MNFLAHLLLSGNKEGIILGNYVGDFVKGRLTDEKTQNWNKDYLLGLRLHRYIDQFTDSHETVREAKRTAAKTYGKMAGIVVDIYFDYFLARYFDRFSNEKLGGYTHRMYVLIEKNKHFIPEHMLPMVRSMIKQDWLTCYATYDGIELTFTRLSGRMDYLKPIGNAVNDLRAHEDVYLEKFNRFFPELQQQSALFIQENS